MIVGHIIHEIIHEIFDRATSEWTLRPRLHSSGSLLIRYKKINFDPLPCKRERKRAKPRLSRYEVVFLIKRPGKEVLKKTKAIFVVAYLLISGRTN